MDTSDRSPAERAEIPPPPRGIRSRIAWLGPGVTWLAAGAGGAGELLFPPRVGSLYGYTFMWALVLAVVFKWFINREIGRFAVSTGASLLDGFHRLPGPANWAVWLIVALQLLVSIAAFSGLASSAATAVILVAPGGVMLWLGVILLSVMVFLLLGWYSLLGDYWGRFGFWLMVGGVFIGFYNTVLTNGDGWARLLGNGTRILASPFLRGGGARLGGERLRKGYVVFVTLGAFGFYALVGSPVGQVGAVHVQDQGTDLPRGLRPGTLVTALTVLSTLFYAGFAVFFILSRR